MLKFISKFISEGTNNVLNLGSFVFGITGVIICLVVVIAPYKILEVMSTESINFLGLDLGKNGALGLLLTSGVIVAAITQPLIGSVSDRVTLKIGKRLPFILVSGLGTSISLITIYFANSFYFLIGSWILIQFFANLGEGPANALLKDHVHESKFGTASGKFNFLRVAGALVALIGSLQFMNLYDNSENKIFFLLAIIYLIILILISTFWSFVSLKNPDYLNLSQSENKISKKTSKWDLAIVLIIFSVTLFSFSSLQSYALFLLSDVLEVENLSLMMTAVIIALGLSVGASIIPAGKLSDRYSRKSVLIYGGLIGCVSCYLLIIFHTPIMVILLCCGIGLAVGSMFSAIWALTNDVISKDNAGNQIGLLAIGFLIAGLSSRLAGILIDFLNNKVENLGYFGLLAIAGSCFILGPMATFLIKDNNNESISNKS
ncbi:MAG: MFS transporter [Dehalococcoidia bacterium]